MNELIEKTLFELEFMLGYTLYREHNVILVYHTYDDFFIQIDFMPHGVHFFITRREAEEY